MAKTTEKSWSLTTNSKFSAIYHHGASIPEYLSKDLCCIKCPATPLLWSFCPLWMSIRLGSFFNFGENWIILHILALKFYFAGFALGVWNCGCQLFHRVEIIVYQQYKELQNPQVQRVIFCYSVAFSHPQCTNANPALHCTVARSNTSY